MHVHRSQVPSQYAITETLLRSARWSLYRAVRKADRHPVVLKVLEPQHHPQDAEQLRHEYEIGSSLDLRAVVKPLALEALKGMPVLVFEDFGGQPLGRMITGPMATDRFLDLALRIAGAVAELHGQGVVHKDLKPENILAHPDTFDVKLAGLGLASRLTRELQPARPPQLIEGTLAYMSPEQTRRMNRALDSRTDLYSLGVTLYQMLTGQLPFEARDPLEWVHCHLARAPVPPRQIVPGIPEILERVVLRLLAKMADDRYQTAGGLRHDLGRCLEQWRERGRIAPFSLGERDIPEHLQIPQKLYGRSKEVAELRAAFNRVVERGTPEFVLVSGYSGVGKSSLVRELHRPITRERGFFISGKFDQYKRDIPYSTFAQAFADLMEQLLADSKERLAFWRRELKQALGASGQVVIDIVPQLELIIGPQPATAPLPPLEAQNRFHMVLRQFIGVFARKEHPLALFLDDLQWLDSGSLRLIEDLITAPQARHLLILGAYRDNEVGPSHPLMLMLANVRKTEAIVHELVLAPLTVEHLGQFLADALRCTPAHAEPLSRLVYEKTAGNPFFAIQFLSALYEESLLVFDGRASKWRWDLARIRAKGFADNVVDLMARKLRRFPPATQEVLKLAACVGSAADLHTLAVLSRRSDESTERALSVAVREGPVLRTGDVFEFVHDRIQQAAYSLIEDDEKKKVHLTIGRLFRASLGARELEEKIFDVVNQLNLAVELIADSDEKDGLVTLNLKAGRKAKASIAYAPAKNFLAAAAGILPRDAWESRYDVVFQLTMERAECEYLSGAFEQAESLFDLLLARARTDIDKSAVFELRLKLYHVAGKYDAAVAMALNALRLFGVELPGDDEALQEATRAEAKAVKVSLGDRKIADLADAAEASDPDVRAVIGLLSNVAPAAYIGTRPQIFPLIILKLVNHSLKYGHTYESCMGYSAYGFLLVSLFDDPHSAYEFSEMSIKLNQKLGDVRRRGTVLHLHGDHINPWLHHISTDFPILERGFLACIDAGDLVFANFIAFEVVWQAVERGDAVDDILEFSKKYAAFARDSRNDAVFQTIRLEQQFLACLKGRTRTSTIFDDERFEETPCVARIAAASFGCGIIFYHMMKLIAAYLADDNTKARAHANEAKKNIAAAMAMPMEATFYYFHALVLARSYDQAPEASDRERSQIRSELEHDCRKLEVWAGNCPENFLTKHALAAAEIARVTGDEPQAERRYEEAIRSARDNGFVQSEALAYELASRFYRSRGFEQFADTYLRSARSCYERWGADGKVRQLVQLHPQLLENRPLAPTSTLTVPAEQLDLLSVTKASQTLSGEMDFERLLGTLLRTALEQGGANRGCLVLERDGALFMEAEAVTGEKGVSTHLPPRALAALGTQSSPPLPVSVIQSARLTREPIILDDAVVPPGRFSGDPYFSVRRPRSLLCLPILRQAVLVGFLYLENSATTGAFTPDRLSALTLLASQAAISVENARLLAKERASRSAAEGAQRRSAFIAEAGALLSEPLEYEETLTRLGRLCVRSLADWCVIDILEGREVRRVAGAHADPQKAPLLEELRRRYPPRWDSPHPAAQVLRTGQPLLMSELPTERLRQACENDEHEKLVRDLGTRSGISVPLIARGTLLGVLSIVSGTPGRYQAAELELAQELAFRAAIAVDHARLYQATQEAIRLRDEFLSTASHELRTPIQSAQLAIQTLGRSLHKVRRSESSRMLDIAARQTQRLSTLVNQLLDVARIQGGRLTLTLDEFDLVALAQQLLERMQVQIESSGSPIVLHAQQAIPGHWDRSRLDQLLTNLFTNALTYGAGRPIEVTIEQVRTEKVVYARINVRDQGIGIPADRLPYIFERFERATSTRNYGGLGLGLFIARQIVQAHGGSISVESKLGSGSSFTVDLPVQSPVSAP